MTEEFAIDSAFRDRTTVDSKITFASAWTIVVDDARKNLLAHSTFANYKHTKVCGRHLHGNVQCTI